jgi:Polyketide cyclase / dehydrase and lipid transport
MGFFPQDPITGTITAATDAKTLYEMVTDVTRMGEWSPECRSCRWDDGAGPTVGSWFTGVNVLPESEQDRRHVLGSWWTGSLASPDAAWEGRCEVVVADPYAEFSFVPFGQDQGPVRWSYRFQTVGSETEVSEMWNLIRPFPWLEQLTDRQLVEWRGRFQRGIDVTLENLKRAAEASS